MTYQLTHLSIKPFLGCNANCMTCSYRKDLHKDLIKNRQLSFEDWTKILDEARTLGVERLNISGGEPTLYKKLPDLITIGKSFGWHVNVNTNGSLITESSAHDLLKTGLNSITVSLYSPEPETHDKIRQSKGLWDKATQTIRLLSSLENQYPHFKVKTQTLLCRENYRNFDQLIKFHYKLGSHSIALSYLEGDFDKMYLMNAGEIADFKMNVQPRIISFCQILPPSIKQEALNTAQSLFSEDILNVTEWEQGIYRPLNKGVPPCQRPQYFAMILSNGDVHPCNMIEYTHEPVMGNLFDNSLTHIWYEQKWNDFRQNLFNKCELCPINLYLSLPLKSYQKKSIMISIKNKLKSIYQKGA